MEGLAVAFGIVSAFAILGIALNQAARALHGRDAAIATAARALGLRRPANEGSGSAVLEGVVAGRRVSVERLPLRPLLRISVDGGGDIPPGLRWGDRERAHDAVRLSQTSGRRLARLMAQIAHPYQVPAIVGLFRPKERAKVVAGLSRLCVEVSGGELFREIDASVSGLGLIRCIRHTVRLVDILARGLAPACERGLTHGDPQVRLEAARILGRPGLATLRSLALDDATPASVAVEALQGLDAAADRQGLTDGLMRVLEQRKDEARLFAIETVAAMPCQQAASALATLLTDDDREAATAAARALGAVGAARAEHSLIAVLGSDNAELRMAAAEALGSIGTAAAIEPLLALVRQSWFTAELDDVARSAVARIQARLPGAEAGQLSIADSGPGRGALSEAQEADGVSGALSLPEASQAESPVAAPTTREELGASSRRAQKMTT